MFSVLVYFSYPKKPQAPRSPLISHLIIPIGSANPLFYPNFWTISVIPGPSSAKPHIALISLPESPLRTVLPLEPSRRDYFSSVVFAPLGLEESWCSPWIPWLLKALSPVFSPDTTSSDSHNKSFHSIHFIVAAMWEGSHSPSFLKDFSSCFVSLSPVSILT